MRKILALMLSAVIIITPVYSYAVLPILGALGTAASLGGRVLIGNAVRKPTGTALRKGLRICLPGGKPSLLHCLSAAAYLYDLLRDKGYTIEQGDTINEGDININIYKDRCEVAFSFGSGNPPSKPIGDLSSISNSALADYQLRSDKSNESTDRQYSLNDTYDRYIIPILINPKKVKSESWVYGSRYFIYFDLTTTSNGNNYKDYAKYGIHSYHRCPTNNRIYMSQTEINTIIDQSMTNLTANDILNIYNYDYSQHPNITINNNSTSGDSINNNFTNSPHQFNVSDDLKNKINNNTVDMDDINDTNCSKDNTGAYDKCGDDKDEPTPDPDPDPTPDPDNPPPDNGTDTDEPEDPKDPVCPPDYTYDPSSKLCTSDPLDEPQPEICASNEFTQKICDWIDWTKEKHDMPTDTKVDIIDKSDGLSIDKDRIDFNNQCPPPTPIGSSVGGFAFQTELDYQPLCDFFTMLNPFVVGIGGISSALIIGGAGRRS